MDRRTAKLEQEIESVKAKIKVYEGDIARMTRLQDQCVELENQMVHANDSALKELKDELEQKQRQLKVVESRIQSDASAYEILGNRLLQLEKYYFGGKSTQRFEYKKKKNDDMR